MPRELSEKDIEILKKLAPEYSIDICPGSGQVFRSILPPLSNHISENINDFRDRLSILLPVDWEYLTSLILSGEESVGCLDVEYLDVVLAYIGECVSEKDAERIKVIYELSSCGMI
ncbi:hypothetical protein F1737_02860 [Methanoplanus sp. FWC-SCC4]|uniref:Uncharacterized protein n=1 Tax=Methanochimaera problematica TaxID=2609417 RepID=A0AA97FB82_9EURY|nr:hypothetical protein [Methanoplanus sp. FWC-SCC4]WOF15702.1 hypothetical protein F1737_02860 [Methanoplanus sp. FWC-SCC4]